MTIMKTPKRSSRRRAGFTLIELLMYTIGLAIIVNLCATMFVSSSRISGVGTSAMKRMEDLQEVHQGFLKAIREAEGIADQVASYRSSEDQLVLRLSPSEGQARYGVIGRLRSDTHLSYMEFTQEGDTFEPDSLHTWQLPIAKATFSYNQTQPWDATLIQLDVTPESVFADGKDSQVRRFIAAPRATQRIAATPSGREAQ
jgi:type II secretory pathway component PulJ